MKDVPQAASRLARSYLWSILIWLSLAPVDAWEDKVGLLDRGLHAPFGILLLRQCAWLLTSALLTPPIFSIVRRYPITGEHRVGRVAGYLFGSLPYLAASVCIRSALLPPWDFAAHQFEHRTVKALLSNVRPFGFQLWCYLAILVAAHAYYAFVRTKAQELEQSELRQALAASELQMLRSQLQPHYLFNTLHGIATLINSDPAKAKASVLKLSNLLRASLEYGTSDLIPLAEELNFAKSYLELEQMRLEERLQTLWDVDRETREILVPQLILQPLVENAILHGIACCREGGWIQIASRKLGERLEVDIRNSVGAKSRQGLGLGHRNTSSRIKHLYANEGSFVFRIGPDDVAVATLSFPGFLSHPRQSRESQFAECNGDQPCVS
ncbi:MAG TPA: histidine kinase [Terracidiphilus sp.]|nr:histidine kinase [Terracidiphilus sp.]